MPFLKWSWIAAAALGVAVVTAGLLWLFLTWTALPDTQQVQVRIDAVKTAFGVGAGAGGVFALWLAARRQRTVELQLIETTRIADETRSHQERVAAVTERDLEERRVTELYTKAVEQLGSDKAPVRLGGLYALERLGQENPKQRQTIVNVLCAYLRMPFTGPDEGLRGNQHSAAFRAMAAEPVAPPQPRAEDSELQVRLAAQEILRLHLEAGVAAFWAGMLVDLQRAALIDFRLSGCTLAGADFSHARFLSAAHIRGTTFTGWTSFYGAEFTGLVNFDGTTFGGDAIFSWAHFRGDARFTRTRSGRMHFFKTLFDGDAVFAESLHDRVPNFEGTRFAHEPDLTGMRERPPDPLGGDAERDMGGEAGS